MDQIKIGKFIAEKRKEHKLTQMQLAERLGVTDRAVSKWETGRSLPDVSIIPELCGILCITVNDLLCGEVILTDERNQKTEELLLEAVHEKETADKRLLTIEIVLGILSSVVLFATVFPAAYVDMTDILRIALIVFGTAIFAVGIFFCLKIEQEAGYYECGKCGHRYVPTFSATIFSMHVNRTRLMKCPKCGKSSWQKKVVGKK